jgi:hypothetical protein
MEIFEFILKNKCVNPNWNGKNTMLQMAVKKEQTRVVELLLGHESTTLNSTFVMSILPTWNTEPKNMNSE